jgi:hypothetical protein
LASTDPHELKEQWLEVALREAGIDRARWRPFEGVDDNRRTIEEVYDYYGRLFARNPFLLWAGMASMVGPAFFAAFLDLGFFPDKARELARTVFDWTSRRQTRAAAGALGYYETLFLTMQKKIFEDQATMHEAYLEGGVAEIERFYQANIIDLATLEAWRQIDQGRPDNAREPLESACRALLWREQRVIIAHSYDMMMRHNGLQGQLFTYAMTCIAAPSVPGAHSESQVYPFILTPPVLRWPSLTTPLADGNLARFVDRWRLIEHDTLPAYLTFVREHESTAIASALTPAFKRAAQYRLHARARALLTAAVTRWRLSLGSSTGAGPGGTAEQMATSTDARLSLNLEHAPAAGAVGIPSGARTHFWASATPRPLSVQVRLPGRVYDAGAALVAATRLGLDGRPNHIAVILDRDDLTTEDLVRRHASASGVDDAELAASEQHAQRVRAAGDRAHSTHVLGPVTAGPVKLEFEVAHHVPENESVVSALFSW